MDNSNGDVNSVAFFAKATITADNNFALLVIQKGHYARENLGKRNRWQ